MKISLIIPTRERVDYLRYSLLTALAIRDPSVEVIVSDNHSHDGTAAFLDTLDDPKLKVVRPPARVSMRQNFECGLAHATGDYMIFFGDDDAVLPGQFAALRQVLAQHRPDCLSWSKMSYGWPRESARGKFGGVRFERDKLFGSVRPVDLTKLARRLLDADLDWHDEYPALYHGAVSRACVERLREPGQDFFRAKVPDIYFTMLGILTGIEHLHSDHPFTINGHSPASTGGAYARQKSSDVRHGKPEDAAAKFRSEAESDFIQDPIHIGTGIAAAFFETLESVRQRLGKESVSPNFLAWYSFVISGGTNLSTDEKSRQIANMMAHAEANGTQESLHIALGRIPSLTRLSERLSRRRLVTQFKKIGRKVHSFRLNVGLDGVNTVSTAAQVADFILADAMVDRISGTLSRRNAWNDAVTRAKPYSHEF